MPSNERSAEWLRGAVAALTQWPYTTYRASLLIREYRSSLAAAEASEATPLLSLKRGKPRECTCLGSDPCTCAGPPASEVIEAAERAIIQLTPTHRGNGCFCPHYVDIDRFGHGVNCKTANAAIALIARYKEAK